MTKIFAIFKAKEKKNDKSPDYNISIQHNGVYKNVGGCWIKEGKNGKFFSCKLASGYKDIPGFELVPEKQSTLTEEEKAQIAAARAGEATKVYAATINPDDIPF